jgi:uncharacterized membrane protein
MASNQKAVQMVAAAAGAALAFLGFKKGGVVGSAFGVVGAGIAASSIATVAGVQTGIEAPREVRQSIEVKASPEEVFRLWSSFEEFPRFMHNVVEIKKTAEGAYRWTVEGPLGQTVEWDSRLIHKMPGRMIAWRSTTPGIENAGEVHFESIAGGTRVFAVMTYDQPVGPIGKVVALVTGGDPDSMLRQDLGRFKRLVESIGTGRPERALESLSSQP